MALSELQKQMLKIISINRSESSYMAGGALEPELIPIFKDISQFLTS